MDFSNNKKMNLTIFNPLTYFKMCCNNKNNPLTKVLYKMNYLVTPCEIQFSLTLTSLYSLEMKIFFNRWK